MTEARELLQGMRDAMQEMRTLIERRDALEASIAGAKSTKTRDPEMNVQHSRDVSDHMGEVAAEVVDLDADISRLQRILEADRQRASRIIPYLGRDEREIVRLYFVSPVKNKAGDLRTWQEVEELMHLSHTAVMQRRRKLIADVDRIIEENRL